MSKEQLRELERLLERGVPIREAERLARERFPDDPSLKPKRTKHRSAAAVEIAHEERQRRERAEREETE